MASPGISYWLGSTIHSLFHSLCPLGLITINLTPCLSDAAARSAGLGEMFTKAMDHQHFDCGTPNCHFSLCPQWSHQPSVPMISMQWLVPVSVPAPGKPTWRPVTLCLSVLPLSPLKQRRPARFCLLYFVFQWMGSFCGLGCCSTLFFFCLFCTSGCLTIPYISDRIFHNLEFTTAFWSTCQFIVIVFEACLKKRKEILPSWLLLNWIFFLRWWWTIALWILVLCK